MVFTLALKLFIRRKRSFVFLFALVMSFSIASMFSFMANYIELAEFTIRDEYKLPDLYVSYSYFNSSIVSDIKEISENIRASAGLYWFSMNLLFNSQTYRINIIGIEKDPEVASIPSIKWSNFSGYIAVVDVGLAEELELKIGDNIDILNASFRIIEITYVMWATSLLHSGEATIVVPIETLWKIIGRENLYNTIAIRLRDRTRMLEAIYKINDYLTKLNISAEYRPTFVGTQNILMSLRGFYEILNIAVTALVTLILILFVYLDINASYRDLAILEAIGFSIRDTYKLYIYRLGLMIGVAMIGANIIGNFVSYSLTLYAIRSIYGIDLPIALILKLDLSVVFLPAIIGFLGSLVVLYVLARRQLYEYLELWSEIGGNTIKIAPRNLKVKIAIRNIFRKRLRSAVVVFLIASSFGLSSAMLITVKAGERTYVSVLEKFGWDLSVVLYEKADLNTITRDIQGFGIEKAETVVFGSVPIQKISGNERKFLPPFGDVDLFGIWGNESMINLDIEGSLRDGPYVVIGRKIADYLGISIGSIVEITFTHPLGFNYSLELEVSGIANTAWNGGIILAFYLGYLLKNGFERNAILLKTNKEPLDVAEKIEEYLSKRGISHHIITRKIAEKLLGNLSREMESFLIPIITVSFIFVSMIILGLVVGTVKKDLRMYAIFNAVGLSIKDIIIVIILENIFLFLMGFTLSIPITILAALTLIKIINNTNLNLWINISIEFSDIIPSIAIGSITLILVLISISLWFYKTPLHEALKFE